ncbi:MAG TPA: hypothetical protein VNX28_14795, partial [Gemmataceae bacterium]|nr:hypothetical protein [Gemmataceae bacterium]
MKAALLESGDVLVDTGKGMVTVDPSHADYLKLRQRLARPAKLSETQKLKQIAVANYSRLTNDLRKVKDETFTSPAAVMRFVDSIAERVTQGLVKEGALHRTEDSPKHHFTDVAELPAARQQFAEELFDRLNDPAADPIETAGWANWRLDLTDHFYSDGVGKTAEALSEFILMRAGLDAPTYDPSEAFAKAPSEKFSPANGGRSYTRVSAYARWQGHYRSMFPNDLDTRVAKRYSSDESQLRRDLWQRIKAAAAEVDTSPTDAQKQSGTYKKGHVVIQGLPVTIENPAGSTRSGTSKDGKAWQVTMGSHYGYLKRADSADGDNLDVFIGPEPTS